MRSALLGTYALLAVLATGCGSSRPQDVGPVDVSLRDSTPHELRGTGLSVRLATSDPAHATVGDNVAPRAGQATLVLTHEGHDRTVTLRAPAAEGVSDSALVFGYDVQLVETMPAPHVRVAKHEHRYAQAQAHPH